MKKRLILRQPPDAKSLRATIRLANDYLDYVDFLIDHRPWLAGSTMSLADLAAAAQISVADYLGGIDWSQHEPARGWYSALKSRPSFRPRRSPFAPASSFVTLSQRISPPRISRHPAPRARRA